MAEGPGKPAGSNPGRAPRPYPTGTEYEIDLSAAHSDELRQALGQYLVHARRVGGTARGSARGRRDGAAVDTAKIREWAKGQGIEVKDRGRVPADVVERYKTAAGA